MLRVHNRANYTYHPRKPISNRKPLIEAPRFAHSVPDEVNCACCGWPLSAQVGSPVLAGVVDGERAFKHYRCPTTRERALLRREALVSA